MTINETVNFNGQIKVDNGEVEVPVVNLTASLNTSNMNLIINATTINKELAEQYAETVRNQYDLFENTVKTRAIELGYVLF